MSIKVAIGSKIYDISNFSEQDESYLTNLSKSLNYRVNQIISAFGIYDQEMAIIMSALSLLEELESKEKTQEELFPEYSLEKKEYSKEEVEEIVLNVIFQMTQKLEKLLKNNA